MIPFYDWFYNVILTSANSVPIQSLWVAFFTHPMDLNRAIQAGRLENGVGYYTLAGGAAVNTAQGAMGALFTNSITIPGDGMDTSKIGADGYGGIKGNISNGRKSMENLTLSFLDTNMSFVDYNIRPWAIYASHKSLKDASVKQTITIIQLAKSGPKLPLVPRAIWTFHGACPVSISSQQWTYGADNVVNRQVEFAYNYYLLNADPAITALQTVKSVLDPTGTKYTSQPKSVPRGGLTSHKGSKIVNIPETDSTSVGSHGGAQLVSIPEEDMVSRAVNLGLSILNGNSNVKIDSDDAINRLRIQGEEILQSVKIPEGDSVEHNAGTSQTGHVMKEPVGPNGNQDADHITREAPERVQSGRVPVGGNSKQNAKDNADTPLFFPNDGGEGSIKIDGRTVGGESDTPDMNTLSFKQVVVERTGTVGRNIPLQIITISKDDMGVAGNKTSQLVTIDGDDSVTTSNQIKAKLVNVSNNDQTYDGNIPSQLVVINSNDTRK